MLAGSTNHTRFKIDRGIPLPPRKPLGNPKGRPAKYPFASLDVGDSFYVKRGAKDPKRFQQLMSAQAWAHGRKFGKRFSTRTDESGVRIWRVA